ncbi:uridine-cytidine kinase-like 1 isoform X9 [Heterocephalus glaber]|uniref:Uridine-cytidine kinase n=1 Tax=Heterocephalus glaber TaxID=10181 RepID=A0AAX6QU45_HETGA|nr:uridine-cytidine kinase-like 1 isoform X9 [Heterocephalus glaber]
MAAPPASANAAPSPPLPPAAPDASGRQAEHSEAASEDRPRLDAGHWLPFSRPFHLSSNAGSLDRLLPPVGTGHSPRKRTTSQCKSEPPLLRTSKRTIYTAGRPPWYNEHGTQSKEAFAIGLGGGSASGKTTVARMIIEALDVPWVVLLSMDSFYKVLTQQQQEQAACNNFNFDHPDAFDFDLIISTLKKLKQGRSVQVPIYDFTTHSRKKEWKMLYGANVIIFEGIMAFADKTLLELLDMKIFVDTDSDIRLVRRLRRDISERGRDIEGVIKQYNKFVKPAFDQYIQPTMRLADIVVPRGSGNTVAIDLIVQHVHSQLEERELSVRGSCVGICEQSALLCCAVCLLPRAVPAPPSLSIHSPHPAPLPSPFAFPPLPLPPALVLPHTLVAIACPSSPPCCLPLPCCPLFVPALLPTHPPFLSGWVDVGDLPLLSPLCQLC